MTVAPNLWSDVSSISNSMLQGAYHVIREQYQMENFVTVFTDMTGANPRKSFKYNQLTANALAENDDLVSQQFLPSADQTLTPIEIGVPFFVSDLRAESEVPESIIRDGSLELGMAAGDKVESYLLSDIASLTGGTIGAAGTAITWGYVAAAIAVARNVNKSASVPLVGVIHGYQAAVLAKSASIAGATTVAATGVADQVTRQGFGQVFTFMGVPIYQVFGSPNTSDDFTGGVFPKIALAIDWRRRVRIEGERKASRRGYQFNMSAVFAHGVWRPAQGVQMIFDATAPSS
jgi:hypothetical protein